MGFWNEIIVICLMLFLNTIFVAYEMALASISRVRLTVLVNNKRKGAEEAVYMKDHMEASLAVVQVFITLCGAIAAATGGAGVTESLTPFLVERFRISYPLAQTFSLLFLIIPLSGVMIVFGELVPKIFALNNKAWVCLVFSPMMKILSHVMYPLIVVFEKFVKWITSMWDKLGVLKDRPEDKMGLHELTAAVSLARASRLIGAREEKIVLAAAQLSVRSVKQIIIRPSEICMIPKDVSLNDALVRAHMDMHTRFPVCAKDGDPQTVEGYVNFKDILMALRLNPGDPTIKGIIRSIKLLDEDMPISHALEQMIQEKIHIAVVRSQDGAIRGMVTLEDIIEELVGEIEDEYDRLPNYVHPYAGGWVMGGGVPMSVLAQTAGIEAPAEWKTEPLVRLAEWCSKRLGSSIKGGETLEVENLQIMVRKLRRKKVDEAIISLIKK